MRYNTALYIAKAFSSNNSNNGIIKAMNEWIMFSCPFSKYIHKNGTDNNPSFGINWKNNVYNCFSCGKSGSLYTLPFQLEHYSKLIKDDIDYEWLKKAIVEEPVEFFDIKLPKNKEYIPIPLDFLENFYSPDFVYKYITPKMFNRHCICTDDTYDRLYFPIFNKNKELISIKVRDITVDKNFYTLKIYNGIELPDNKVKNLGIWYGEHIPLVPTSPLYLVEGERDKILLNERVKNVWASMGSKITKEQLNTLKKADVKEIVLFFDNDEAGIAARKEVIYNVKNLFKVFIIKNYMGCKDPAEAYETGKINSIKAISNFEEV